MSIVTRPIYKPRLSKPYYSVEEVPFEYTSGAAPSVKTRNSLALRDAWLKDHPEEKILEVSTKSDTDLGRQLSPFNLTWEVGFLKKAFPVESIYHASKVFKSGGPYVDLFGSAPLDAKRDPRLNNSGELVHFRLNETQYPASPDILYYNWLYIQGLMDHPSLASSLMNYDGFTDIEFNPAKGKQNQAKACAIYTSLARLGKASRLRSFEEFKNLFTEEELGIAPQRHDAKASAKLTDFSQPPVHRNIFTVGQWLSHPEIGKGEVIRRTTRDYLINFRVSGPRTISRKYVERFCTPCAELPKRI